MHRYRSNGKLLITGEYVVLDGAKALAVPSKFGQSLNLFKGEPGQIHWSAILSTGKPWLNVSLDIRDPSKIIPLTNRQPSTEELNKTQTLIKILEEAQKLNPEFINPEQGYEVETKLEFPTDWGLGSSSTLITNIAQWAEVNPYTLLWNSFKGSGYDIACASYNQSLIYELNIQGPKIQLVNFKPQFLDALFFVHLNKKQNSREGIERYKTLNTDKNKKESIIQSISELTLEFTKADSLESFEELIVEHENIIASTIQLTPAKQQYFKDFKGSIKSLGAWGGDFILATGEQDYIEYYFKKQGYSTILPYEEMVLY